MFKPFLIFSEPFCKNFIPNCHRCFAYTKSKLLFPSTIFFFNVEEEIMTEEERKAIVSRNKLLCAQTQPDRVTVRDAGTTQQDQGEWQRQDCKRSVIGHEDPGDCLC